ncbi:MAG: hypothetical protein ACYS99_02310 [Planctomycetota bacterium]
MFLLLVLLMSLDACCNANETVDGQPVYPPTDLAVAGGPETLHSRFKVYILIKTQYQRYDFNGIFQFFPDRAIIVPAYWSRKFVEFTRPGHYDEFFLEFYDKMAGFAQTYPVITRKKEKMLDSLERSFHVFCAVKKVEKEFVEFKKRQEFILGN